LFRYERDKVKLRGVRTVKLDSETGELLELDVDDFDNESAHSNVEPYIIPEELIENAKEQAELIIEAARNEAADVILAGKEEAEVNSRKAWDEGYANGVKEGKRSYDEKILECGDSLKRVIKELHDERSQTYSSLENELVDLSLKIVRKVINPSDEAMDGVFESLIRNALRQIAPDDKIMLRISPADYDRFFSEGNAVFELGNGITVSASILKDVSLGEYDCIIDKDDSTVNAGLDTQLKRIELAFRNK
jgi:flagellar assembly protein FliH